MALQPLVTIAIPVYNRRNLVLRAIKSALDQNYENINVVVVDNCSTDGTYEALLKLAGPKCTIYQNSTNIGPVANWLTCIHYSTGEYIKILFSDDWMEPNAVSSLMRPFLNNLEIGFSFSCVNVHKANMNCQIFYDQKLPSGIISSFDFLWSHCVDKNAPVSPGAALFRKQDLLRFFCDHIPHQSTYDGNKLGAGNDGILYWRACEYYKYVYYVSEPVNHFSSSNEDEPSITMSNIANGVIDKCYKNAFLYWLESSILSKNRKNLLRNAAILVGYTGEERWGKLVRLIKEFIRGRSSIFSARLYAVILKIIKQL